MIATLHAASVWLHPLVLPAMVTVFVLTTLSLYWPDRRDRVEQPGRIPLEDDR